MTSGQETQHLATAAAATTTTTISCDCRKCQEQSSYQHHSINLFAIFQETTLNVFIYQILPISLIFLPVIFVPCPRSYHI